MQSKERSKVHNRFGHLEHPPTQSPERPPKKDNLGGVQSSGLGFGVFQRRNES